MYVQHNRHAMYLLHKTHTCTNTHIQGTYSYAYAQRISIKSTHTHTHLWVASDPLVLGNVSYWQDEDTPCATPKQKRIQRI